MRGLGLVAALALGCSAAGCFQPTSEGDGGLAEVRLVASVHRPDGVLLECDRSATAG